MSDYAKNTYERMIALGLTISDLARTSGVPRDEVSRILRNQVKPSEEVKARLDAVLRSQR